MAQTLHIRSTWDGTAIAVDEAASVVLERTADGGLAIEVLAPSFGDPPPPGPVGPTDGLWEYEVIEVFLLGEDERYLELEFGPHGHYLALALHGVRHRVAGPLPLTYRVVLDGSDWIGRAEVPSHVLPPGLGRVNAYAIHGQGANRRYLAAYSVGGTAPDFHRLDRFVPLTL